MVFIGVRATPMVALTAFSVGVTLAMQAAHSLQQLGAEIYVPDLVMVTLLREMGPVLIAVIVIGRSGSAVAAELGTMKVSEEIEALEVMAINPISYLIVPRFLAMLVMLPALTILGNYIGVFGGWAVCHFALDFNTAGYVMRALESAETWDLYSGMIKSAVFAWIIITIACNAGLHVEGGAEGVGQATTASVVQALLAMLVTNAILTGIFFLVHEMNDEVRMTNDKGITKGEKGRDDFDEAFWNDNTASVVREEPSEKRVYDLEERTARFGRGRCRFCKNHSAKAGDESDHRAVGGRRDERWRELRRS